VGSDSKNGVRHQRALSPRLSMMMMMMTVGITETAAAAAAGPNDAETPLVDVM